MSVIRTLRPAHATLVDVLQHWVHQTPDKQLFTFLLDGEVPQAHLTYAGLDRRARAIGSVLQESLAEGSRALLLYPSGLEFIEALFGCLYSGTIAVPASPPHPPQMERSLSRLKSIIVDAAPQVGLTTAEFLPMVQAAAARDPVLGSVRWLATDLPAEGRDSDFRPTKLPAETLALLQYTSGSTEEPKGVMLTHGNLVANLEAMHQLCEMHSDTVSCTWLPLHHDMGLIGCVMGTLYNGGRGVIMSPSAFLSRPRRWLQALSTTRATHTAAPPFAYALCARKIPVTEREGLDLSHLEFALAGADTLHREGLLSFVEAFKGCGFRPEALYPAYGLAECTVLAAGGKKGAPLALHTVRGQHLSVHRVVPGSPSEPDARTLVGCGQPPPDHEILIVTPERRTLCPPEQVGEIWISGPSVGQGYWNRPEATRDVFQAQLADSQRGAFLRTGDLGFIHEGQLYLTGRMKDLIILRGRNHYPQDIERTAEECHPLIRPGCSAAFTVEKEGAEALVVLAEVQGRDLPTSPEERGAVLQRVLHVLRGAVGEQHQVPLSGVVLLEAGSLPKTSSGKLQRAAAARALAQGELAVEAEWWRASPDSTTETKDATLSVLLRALPERERGSALLAVVRAEVAAALELEGAAAVQADQPLQELGLESLSAVELRDRLSRLTGAALPATLVFEHPTALALSDYLYTEVLRLPAVQPSTAEAVPSALPPEEPIAVIGMAVRAPADGTTLPDFWKMLEQGATAVTPAPAERWGLTGPARWGALLKEDAALFDAAFFGISPREATNLDPQQRLLLEVAWEALEQAGMQVERLNGSRTGVYVGMTSTDYRYFFENAGTLDAYTTTGNILATAAGRISYSFGFQGPAMTLDTACSSSLTAVHLAIQSLRRGESDLALAGGVNLILHPSSMHLAVALQALSPEGKCRTFDAGANGFVRGEGCGMVVLKRLGDAQRDGDPILALLRGSAINQDGRSVGLTAPNVKAQQALLRQALDNAGLSPEQIGYVELHGTGTPLGDPIEYDALRAVLGQPRADDSPCVLGAVKSNIGHLEAAAGVMGLIKTVLCLRHEVIPPNLHLEKLNPRIQLEGTPFVLPSRTLPWVRNGTPRRAGVSSFGLSGTNVHVIVQEAPEPAAVRAGSEAGSYVLPVSARSAQALAQRARDFADWVERSEEAPRDLAYTASVRRSHHKYRLAVVGASKEELARSLRRASEDPRGVGVAQSRAPRVVFVFSGQGTQWAGMGMQLARQEEAFAQALRRWDGRLRKYTGFSIIEEMGREAAETRLEQTEVAQAALFGMQVALVETLRKWGIEPDAVIGHSVGEVAAAYVAGILEEDEAARLCALRGRLMQQRAEAGAMVAVACGEAEAVQALRGRSHQVGIAAVNEPGQVVVSGKKELVEEVVEQLKAQGKVCQPLRVAYGFHSPQMEDAAAELEREAGWVEARRATRTMVSTVTGQQVQGPELDGKYWGANVRGTVRFAAAVQEAMQQGSAVFVEIGPHPALVMGLRKMVEGSGGKAVETLRKGREERRSLQEAAAELYAQGYGVDFGAMYEEPGRVVELPRYPWQKERFWIQASGPGRKTQYRDQAKAGEHKLHPLLGEQLAQSSLHPQEHVWEFSASVEAVPYLDDHRLQSAVVFPGTGFVELMAGACAQRWDDNALWLDDVLFERMLVLPKGTERQVQAVLTEEEAGRATLEIASRAKGEPSWQRHASARARLDKDRSPPEGEQPTLAELKERIGTQRSVAEHYERMQARGLNYGPTFQGVRELWEGTQEGLGRVSLQEGVDATGYTLHPTLLDACLQVSAVLLGAKGEEDPGIYVPVRMDTVRITPHQSKREVWVWVRDRTSEGDSALGRLIDLRIFSEDGQWLADIRGLGLQRLAQGSSSRDTLDEWIHQVVWRETPPLAEATWPEGGVWLVVSDSRGLADSLRNGLRARGQRCVLVEEGTEFLRLAPELVELNPSDPSNYARLLQEEFGPTGRCAGVVHLASLDIAPFPAEQGESLDPDLRRGCVSATRLVQALVRHGFRDAPRLWLVTRGARSVEPGDGPIAVMQAPLWGLGRTIALEHPELKCTRIDLGPTPGEDDAERLLSELGARQREDEIALRAGGRRVARILRGQPMTEDGNPLTHRREPAGERPFRLVTEKPGLLDRLVLQGIERKPPGPLEVEVAVEVAGLNFIDVMKAMGIYPGLPPGAVPIGSECAGRIVAVGEGVQDLHVGQAVMTFAQSGIATHITVPASAVAPMPDSLSFEQAATLPLVFMTVWYALVHLGRAQRGESILIHSATGGTGLAAIQVARLLGLEIFATAGSEEKREYLRAMGIQHVMDSRSLSFAAEISKVTGGRGVDLVLNSLTGEALFKSLESLAPYGRFLEMGKRDIYGNTRLNLSIFKKSLTYSAIDLAGMALERPELFISILGEVVQQFLQGALKPLPVRVFPASQAEDAFRLMAQARHIGKLAIRMNDPSARIIPPQRGLAQRLRADASYLITGGLGGLGLSLARWMAARGARHIVLMGRRGPGEEALPALEEIRQAGARVECVQADVSRREDVERVVSMIRDTLPPLRGIVHAAAVLSDRVLLEQSAESFQQVFQPKARGALHLHALTHADELDFFILYSSAASLFGSPGQGNYAAANALLDALAHERQRSGLPAVSIQWGAFSDVGMAAQEGMGARLARHGMKRLTPEEGLQALDQLLCHPRPELGCVRLNVQKWAELFPSIAALPLFGELTEQKLALRRSPEAERMQQLLMQATPAERVSILEKFLLENLGSVLRIEPARIDPNAQFNDLGIDSLMGLELKNRLEANLGYELQATVLFSCPNVALLARYMAEQVSPSAAVVTVEAGQPAPVLPVTEDLSGQLDKMSDEELKNMGKLLLQ